MCAQHPLVFNAFWPKLHRALATQPLLLHGGAHTYLAGQSFRWRLTAPPDTYTGVIGQRVVQLRQLLDDVQWRVLARGPGASSDTDAAAVREYFNVSSSCGQYKLPAACFVHNLWPCMSARSLQVGVAFLQVLTCNILLLSITLDRWCTSLAFCPHITQRLNSPWLLLQNPFFLYSLMALTWQLCTASGAAEMPASVLCPLTCLGRACCGRTQWSACLSSSALATTTSGAQHNRAQHSTAQCSTTRLVQHQYNVQQVA
jgi:hypothetical protein